MKLLKVHHIQPHLCMGFYPSQGDVLLYYYFWMPENCHMGKMGVLLSTKTTQQ